jgi:hypothetical protein
MGNNGGESIRWRPFNKAGCSTLIALSLLAGCSPDAAKDPARAFARSDIADTSWTVIEFDGLAIPRADPPAATISFERDGSISGTAGCNTGGSPTKWRDRTFFRLPEPTAVPSLPFTLRGCLDGRSSELGSRFWQRMLQATTWTDDGQHLRIKFVDGSQALLELQH